MNPSWCSPSTVRGFSTAPPNATLLTFADAELARIGSGRALDIGCGAGRNAVPLATLGWDVVGIDRAMPMLAAAAARIGREQLGHRCQCVQASLDHLPVARHSCDLVIAHGIWNLARSDQEFRAGVQEAAGVAKGGAALFVFTFSRSTLPDHAQPVDGESFTFTSFSTEPEVYLTRDQLLNELGASGFDPDPSLPLVELNPRRPGMLPAAGSPVIWQGVFRFLHRR
jgi:SAM-dependent methyltransferase